MCMNWRTCLCWRDTKSPSVAIGVFALVTSLLQILVQIAVFSWNPMAAQSYMESPVIGVIIKVYIALAVADFFVVLFSIIMLVGLERPDSCRYAAVPWIIWIFLYIIYESAINIYFFNVELSDSNNAALQMNLGTEKFLIVPLVYWICKEIILFVGWLFIVSHNCYGDGMGVRYGDSTLHLVDTIPSARTCSLGTRDAVGPIYYNGGVAQVQIRGTPRSSASHFDVVRPTSSCQAYSSNYCRPGGVYLGQNGGIYGPPRYM